MKQWGMWHYCKNKCILPFFSKKWSQKVILCTIFHKFDLFFLFDFNITKMHIFCNFLKEDYCCLRPEMTFIGNQF